MNERFSPTHEIQIISVTEGDTMAGTANSEATVITLTAERWCQSVKEIEANKKDTTIVGEYFKIRYITGIDQSMIVKTTADSRRFEIKGIKPMDYKQQFLILMTEELT